jgi:hypothetical protein
MLPLAAVAYEEFRRGHCRGNDAGAGHNCTDKQ